jgi:hypothetical protein
MWHDTDTLAAMKGCLRSIFIFSLITAKANKEVMNMCGTAYWNSHDLLIFILDESYSSKALPGARMII